VFLGSTHGGTASFFYHRFLDKCATVLSCLPSGPETGEEAQPFSAAFASPARNRTARLPAQSGQSVLCHT